MSLNQILGQFGRILTNRLMNWGINKGIDRMARRNGGTTPAGKMTPQAQKQARETREAVKRARKAAQIARRMGR